MTNNVIIIDKNLSSLNPMQFGYEDCEKGHFFGPAIREYWLLHYVVSGRGVFEINGECLEVCEGEIFVIPPNVVTYYQADMKFPWSYIWIGFTTKDKLPLNLKNVIKCYKAEKIFEDMKKCTLYENGRNAYLCSKLWELFAVLSDEDKNSTNKLSYAEYALEIIHSEYMNNISVNSIADSLNLNRSYLSVVFKEKYKKSPKKYLLDYRMNIAADMLKRKIPVAITSNSVGYTDTFTFSKAFKKQFGISPQQYMLNKHST